MAVILVNRFFHPDLSATSQFVSDLAFALAAEGRDVRVVTSRLRYEEAAAPPLPAREVVAGVQVTRIWTSRFGRAHLPGRTADYLTFYLSAAWCLWRLVRRGDVVIAKTDPPLVSVVAAAICRLRGARLVNWLQDLFPEVAQAFGIGGGGRLAYARRLAYALLAGLRDASLRMAAANVVIGHAMAARVEARGIARSTIRLIPNWADRAAVRPVAHADNPFRRMIVATQDDPFVVVYSGNLGRVHEIDTMVAAMAILAGDAEGDHAAGRRPVRWIVIGSGALTPLLQEEVARRGLDTVAFLPYQPRSALAHSLSAADAHLACLRPEFEGFVVPSKVSGAAAAGRPILFVGDPAGEIGRFVTRYGCGFAISCGDGAGLASAIRELAADPARCAAMGRRARAAFDAEFDRDTALARWRCLLDETVPERTA
ncbi:Glycosyltransferase involved in cell wall bisynthesis [Methylobacterium sp. 174MFSha1.1]|uniref:glycosyltransferase family 4 protein n=1 Tax=Methylobacterium sp. 174MFSha1.1 TaxID=1502749 RepID=UPI0008E3DB2E|nr:glycosyltransferase family 4 protein [Methylobacterium sp. 174MFSha1.1]SFU46930.1 Glycosyltransferase involved in cell wall bisynthesis [Methylobacterium sp. 174MFSha1.1]